MRISSAHRDVCFVNPTLWRSPSSRSSWRPKSPDWSRCTGSSSGRSSRNFWPASCPRPCPGQFSKCRLCRRPSRPRPCFRSLTRPRPTPKGCTCGTSRNGLTDGNRGYRIIPLRSLFAEPKIRANWGSQSRPTAFVRVWTIVPPQAFSVIAGTTVIA